MLNFTSIDFETANFERASACAVGFAIVRNGQIVNSDSFYIYPPTGLDFTNTWIHGIGPEHVSEAPGWEATISMLLGLADGSPFVTYSPFDRGVWNAAWNTIQVPPPAAEFRDALALAKALLQLDGYKLPRVARELGCNEFRHHEPGADARACAQIVLALATARGADDVEELWAPLQDSGSKKHAYSTSRGLPESNVHADPAHPLFGEVVCFSGDLDNYSRNEARQLCANLGAIVVSTVTRKTTLLIMGGFNPATLRTGTTLSSKAQKAQELIFSGQSIEIISEEAFLELLDF